MSLNSDHELPAELLKLEEQLEGLVPASISTGLHARLECSIKGDEDHATATIECFEELEVHLQHLAPATMPTDMINRMARAMDHWHEQLPIEQKLVAFAEAKEAKEAKEVKTRRRRPYGMGMLSAVAAVALLGAITALMIPGGFKDATPAVSSSLSALNTTQNLPPAASETPLISANAVPSTHAGRLLQDSLTHKVTNSSDQGVVLSGDNVPHRCIRVEYIDRVMVERADGRRVMLSRPGVKYVLYPVETH